MTHSFRDEVVRECLGQLGEQFRTKELSQHALMLARHPQEASDGQYNVWVGRYLSRQCAHVTRIEAPRSSSGELWSNGLYRGASQAAHSPPPRGDDAVADGPEAVEAELGPQHAGDDAFTARMRRHQSWYRARVLRLPAGTGPQQGSSRVFGSMLRTTDAELGHNFLTPEIYEVASARLREGARNVERFRLLHNMLSSQPMCFNLFGPLVRDLELATRLLRATPHLDVARVLRVQIEHAPRPAENHLADGTSFDAFIEYERGDGQLAFLGIETKLTDTFSPKVCDTPAHRRWMQGPASPWLAGAAERVSAAAHNQLWRDHLLAIAVRDQPAQRYVHGALMLVRHPEDRSCEAVVAGYRQLLRSDDQTFIDLPLDRLTDAWRAALGGDEPRPWLDRFHQRYLALEESEGAC